MSKPTVTRLFIGGVIAVVAGAILAFAAVWAAYTGGVFEMSGPDVVGINSNPAAWTFIGLAILAAVAIIAGFIAGLVSWIGALLNTADLVDKTWFILLLVLGLLSFGFIAMIAYVIAGPDSRGLPRAQPMHAPA
jgi:H+/Cl- antiporter ClcA